MTLLTGRITAPPAEATKTLTVTHKIEDIVTSREMEHAVEVLDAAMDSAFIRVQPKDSDPRSWIRCLHLIRQLIDDEIQEAERYWRHEENFWW